MEEQWKSIACTIPNLQRSVDAVIDNTGDHVYLRQAKSYPAEIYQYQISTGKWQQPITSFTIRFGGVDKAGSKCTSGLIGVRYNVDGTPSPENILPDMPTRRSRTTTLAYTCNGISYIIVIGGEDDNGATLTTVEIFKATAPHSSWCRGKDIPEALSCSSGAIANGYLYLLGGWSKHDHPTSSAFRCKVDDLIESRQLVVSFQDQKQITEVAWEKLPDLPVQEATCTSFRNTLIVAGGRANTVAVSDIRSYNEDYKRWEVIGYLPHPRYLCFAIGLPNQLIVISGKKDTATNEDSIEIYVCQ